jgi:nitrate reductase cytochrome c-type subunit
MRLAHLPLAACLVLLLGAAGGAALHPDRQPFDHEKHHKLFPSCDGCHAGVVQAGQPIFPPAEKCATCHDGEVQKRVEWAPPPEQVSNLRFTHAKHVEKSGQKLPADSAIFCTQCHTPKDGAWLTVKRTISAQCLDCHKIKVAHTSAPDTACGTCHYPLVEATALPESRIAKFGKPASHDEEGFVSSKGHGEQAKRGDRSCMICHARDFCAQCHVNAPEVKAIQALAVDPRSLALKAELKAPASHKETRWLGRHGGKAKRDPESCATCHTQESCITCHRSRPAIVLKLPESGPGRAVGARIERKKPGYHTVDFADRHAPVASASPGTCSACHARAECLECHRPNGGAGGSYHPAGFLTRHPAAAFNRQTDCTMCHNQAQFCTTCHQQSGLVSKGALIQGFHDVSSNFLLAHGVAARQNIESCITCHSERDCLFCHSAQSGRRFNPHGPGFDADRLRRRNPQTCAACHGRNIPGG